MAYRITDACIACGACQSNCPCDAINEGENGAFFNSTESFGDALDKIIDLKEKNENDITKLPECFQSEFFAKSVANLYETTLKKQQQSPVIKKNAVFKVRANSVKMRVKLRSESDKLKSKVKSKIRKEG